MKKITILFALVMIGTISAHAAKKPMTQAEFVAGQKKGAAEKGKRFSEESSIKKFKEWDLNKDGMLTPEEMKIAREQRTKKTTTD